MYINRSVEKQIFDYIKQKNVLIVFGPRQTGKTTLLKQLFPAGNDVVHFACDEHRIQDQLSPDSLVLRQLIGEHKTVIFDEMHFLVNAGQILKIISDHLPSIQAIATGSAAFELRNQVAEPMTGRFFQIFVLPLSYPEISATVPPVDMRSRVNDCLLYGSYPAVFTSATLAEKEQLLTNIADNYLYKDILAFDRVRNSQKIRDLLVLLALQIGSEVSYLELATKLGMSAKTVEQYIDLLEQTFVVFRLRAWNRNHRSEISRKVKIFFYDCGIRNAILNNFSPLHLRTDAGGLVENYVIAEMVKKEKNKQQKHNLYFWRTHAGSEIDLVLERDGRLQAIEIKSNQRRRADVPKLFKDTYPNSNFTVVAFDNLQSLNALLCD